MGTVSGNMRCNLQNQVEGRWRSWLLQRSWDDGLRGCLGGCDRSQAMPSDARPLGRFDKPHNPAGMNSDDLAWFATVADAGSLSSAALRLGCDASTLSRRMTQLETELGTRLFRRSGRGVTLTPQGETLRDHASEVRTLLEKIPATLSQLKELDPPQIRIAAQPTIAKVLFGDLFHALKLRFPASRIHFSEGLASTILPRLNTGELDAAVLYRPEHTGSLAYEPLVSEQLHLLAPATETALPETLRMGDLVKLPLILPSTHHGLRITVETAAARHGMTPTIALESDSSIAITLQLVVQGCGCTLLPIAAATEYLQAGRLRAHSLKIPELRRTVALVAGKSTLAPHALWEINTLIRGVTQKLVAAGQWPGAAWIGQRPSA